MFNKTQYDMEYAKQYIKRKFIPFNTAKPEDQLLLAWLESQDNVTAYIKGLIRADMERGEQIGK